jgi:versiconal hemiacetal acetate esterase
MVSKYTFPPPDPAVKTEDRTTDEGLKVRVYTPEGYTGGKPVSVYYHGGGWALGDIDGDDPFCRAISKGGGIVVVSVEYGLAPQNKHPGLMDDCWKGFQWTLKNAKDLGGVEGKIITSGVSAGGQLALGIALKAVDEGYKDALVGVVALVPATVHPEGVPEELKSKWTSYEEHAEHTIDTKSAMETFWGELHIITRSTMFDELMRRVDAFGVPPTDPYVSPLLHNKIKDLKKVYLAVAGHDTLRDDGLLFKQKLDDNKCVFPQQRMWHADNSGSHMSLTFTRAIPTITGRGRLQSLTNLGKSSTRILRRAYNL